MKTEKPRVTHDGLSRMVCAKCSGSIEVVKITTYYDRYVVYACENNCLEKEDATKEWKGAYA